MYSAARNHVLICFRKSQQSIEKTKPLDSVKNLISYEQDFSGYTAEDLIKEAEEEFPKRLNENELKLLTLLVYTVDGKRLTNTQIAEQLHCSPKAVSQRKTMLRKKITDILKEIGENL